MRRVGREQCNIEHGARIAMQHAGEARAGVPASLTRPPPGTSRCANAGGDRMLCLVPQGMEVTPWIAAVRR